MSWIAVGSTAVSAVATGVNMYNSSQAQDRAQSQLDAINKTEVPKYSESPALSQAHGAAIQDYFNPQGVTATQRGVFNNNLATNTNANYTNSVNRAGGQIGGFIQGVNNAQNVGAINNFANTDATLTNQNRNNAAGRMDSTAAQIQSVNDRNTQAAINRRMMIEQALGAAIGQQQTNLSNHFTSLGNTGLEVAGYELGRKNATSTNPYGTDVNGNKTDPYTSNGQSSQAPAGSFNFTQSPLALGSGEPDNTNYAPEGE